MSVRATADRVRTTADRVGDRLEERLEPARDRASDRLEEAGERVRHAVSATPDVAERVADEVSHRSRETADRVERYLEDRFGEETLEVWGPRLAFAAGGLLVGLLLGWLVTRTRDRDRDDQEEGFAQAPRTAGPAGRGDRPFRSVQSS